MAKRIQKWIVNSSTALHFTKGQCITITPVIKGNFLILAKGNLSYLLFSYRYYNFAFFSNISSIKNCHIRWEKCFARIKKKLLLVQNILPLNILEKKKTRPLNGAIFSVHWWSWNYPFKCFLRCLQIAKFIGAILLWNDPGPHYGRNCLILSQDYVVFFFL